jgi:predicted outer membrane lipoprotein
MRRGGKPALVEFGSDMVLLKRSLSRLRELSGWASRPGGRNRDRYDLMRFRKLILCSGNQREEQQRMTIDTPLDLSPILPWLLGILAAAGFGVLGRLQGKHVAPWAVGGGLSALLVATLAAGLAHSVSVPYSDEVRRAWQIRALIFTLFVLGVSAGLVLFLYRRSTSERKPQGPT